MPQKKKQKGGRNGFYYFMLDLQKQELIKGNRYTLQEISGLANPLWSDMTLEERKPFNDLALKNASKNSEDLTKKFTSLGISYADLDAEQREIEEARNIMMATIKNTVANLDLHSTMKSHIFFVCHANYFYKSDIHIYYPAEVAFAAFSLELGVLATLHFFVDPGEIPLGFKYEAQEWSTRTHGIPINDSSWEEGIKEPIEMYRRVKEFIKKFTVGTEVPPIYTLFESLNSNNRNSVVRSALNMMCEAAYEDSSLFRVYCLAHLFFEIRNKCSAEIPSVAIMKNELEKDVFSYARDLGCYYHEEKDLSIYCSLSIVTRWVFIICDHCCKHLGIKLVLGRHVPKDTDVSDGAQYMKRGHLSPRESIDECSSKPLTIIDHGSLKEQRAEERRNQEMYLRESEKIRPPKFCYSNKIGARFSQDNSSQLPSDVKTFEDDEWFKVKRRPHGRGRGVLRDSSPEQPKWPISGRGRAFSNFNN